MRTRSQDRRTECRVLPNNLWDKIAEDTLPGNIEEWLRIATPKQEKDKIIVVVVSDYLYSQKTKEQPIKEGKPRSAKVERPKSIPIRKRRIR
ncbi:hypothetical protein C922_05641 [Plasmodium inui San Antonio 1]|uniref:Uncharacterized protein n=1 Tax=Plasmodium inui San Antonio 1 TaxID=1237626 RepID=W6ZXJ3_9APIC|nr:hypothetical protein C922_05641 [Plasmodium inui San Antonio 1]EUD63980.1 hypothetical protein C922_05641 [Plasmodium inui San Antonio 1]